MRQSAALACRSPPRLSRCRTVLPLEAGLGLVPQSAAKDRSLRSRSGLSPAAMSNAAAESGPTPGCSSSAGAVASTSSRSRGGEPVDLVVEHDDAAGGLPQCGLDDVVEVVADPRSQRRAGRDELADGQPTQPFTQIGWGGDHQRVQLVDGLDAGLVR